MGVKAFKRLFAKSYSLLLSENSQSIGFGPRTVGITATIELA